MASVALDLALDLTVLDCVSCGVPFAITKRYEQARRRDHANFYCPAGHSQAYTGKSEEEKLRDQLAAERAKRDQAEARTRDLAAQRDATERRLVAAKGQITKARKAAKRAAAGECPCCGQGFPDLRAHMQAEHPSYAADVAGDGAP